MSTDVNSRAKAAVIGALVADAAVQPLHWVYDRQELGKLLENNPAPEFRSEWACPFYVNKVGSFSCFGDQILCLLKSLVDNKGLSIPNYVKDIYNMFGPDSAYKDPNPNKEDWPKKGPWIHGSITNSLSKCNSGVEDGGMDIAEPDGVGFVIPLVALYAGSNDLDSLIEKAVRTTLNNDKSVRTAQAYGKLLEKCILHGNGDLNEWLSSLPESDVKEEMKVVMQRKADPHIDASKDFGLGCAIPGSFQGMMHVVAQTDDYVNAVRMNISAGGANCIRASCSAAIIAALKGPEAIPEDWIKKTTYGDEVVKLAEQIVQMRK